MKNVAIIYYNDVESELKTCVFMMNHKEKSRDECGYWFFPVTIGRLDNGYVLNDFLPQEWHEIYVIGLNHPTLDYLLYGYDIHKVNSTAKELFNSLADNKGMNPLLFEMIDASLSRDYENTLYGYARGLAYHIEYEGVSLEDGTLIEKFDEVSHWSDSDLMYWGYIYQDHWSWMEKDEIEDLVEFRNNEKEVVVKHFPSYVKYRDVKEYISYHYPNKKITIEVD